MEAILLQTFTGARLWKYLEGKDKVLYDRPIMWMGEGGLGMTIRLNHLKNRAEGMVRCV